MHTLVHYATRYTLHLETNMFLTYVCPPDDTCQLCQPPVSKNRPLLSSHDKKITKTHFTQFAFISTAHIKLILPMTAKLRYICQNKKMVLNLFSVLWKLPTHGGSIEIDIKISYPKALEFIRKETGWP